MNRIIVVLTSLLIVTTPLAGCLDDATLEDLIDDIVGCMDNEAKNYDENATTELVGNCIYAASMEVFMDAMNQEVDIQSMLNQSTTAGYSMSMTTPMSDELGDMGDATMMMNIEETVMVNMSANAAHVSIAMSIPMVFSSTTTMTQVGEVVNVHHKLDGMLVTEMDAETIDEKYQTRDMAPNVMDWVIPMLADSMASDIGGDSEDAEDDLIDEEWDMDSATISVSFDSETNSQTMDLSTTNETGAIMNLSIKIDDNSNLMSYSMVMTNETGSVTHMNYAIMWGEAVVITVDQTLPKTAIPVHWDGLPDFNNHDEHDNDDDGHDHDNDGDSDNEPDMFVCDNGNEIPMDWVNDGMDDCGDNSDEYDNDDSDDGDHDHDNDGDSDNEPDMFVCDNGNEIPMDWVNDGMDDCGDNSDEYDNDDSDDGDHDHDNDDGDEDGDEDDWNEEPRDLFLTVANNQTFEAPLSEFSIQFLSCHSDARSDCNVEESSSLTELTGQMGDSNYTYVDVDADGMISAGDTLEITSMDPSYDFDLYDSWSDSYVSDSGVNGPNMPGFGGILATISMLAAAFLLPRRDD